MNIKLKTSIIVGLLFISVFATIPLATVPVQAQGPSIDPGNADKIFGQVGDLFQGMFGGAGAGAALGQVLSILFNNIWDFELQEFKDVKHVYILNATYTETATNNQTVNDMQKHWLWKELYDNNGAPWGDDVFPYITVERSGDVNITYEYGASIVFLIWDNNDSFIKAINNMITAAKNVKEAIDEYEASGHTQEDQTQLTLYVTGQIVDALTYLFFHINDIINGDELIVMNMVTWESITMETSSDWEVTKRFAYRNWQTATDTFLAPTDPIVQNWNTTAIGNDDEYMKSLLTFGKNGSQVITWSKMTFNVVEIWLKTFQIHVNVDALVEMLLAAQDGSPMPDYAIYQVLQGFEIDIYVITHSLMGFIAYNDGSIGTADGVPTITREEIVDGSNTYDVINGSEAVYYFVPTFDAHDVIFHEPEVKGDGVTWSIELQNVDMKAIPVGIGPYDHPGVGTNTLSYIEIGFTFTPKLKEVVDPDGYSGLAPDMDEVKMAASNLKLDQYFADWTGDVSHLAGLDFAVIYVSTIIHFRLAFEIKENEEFDPALIDNSTSESGLIVEDSYHSETGEIKIGDETGNLPVAGVDIAGPGYTLGTDPTILPASTTTIPLAWANYTATADASFVDTANPSNSFEVGGFLNIEAGVMIYAVSYPAFDGSGQAIWHDPTFSVFMTWDNPGFWAVILVVAGISLVAVAAILITRRKNRV